MEMICRAALNAAQRTTTWRNVPAESVHGLNGHRPRKILQFFVSTPYHNTSRAYFLTSGGVLLRERVDGYVPVQLAEYPKKVQQSITHALIALSR